MPNPFSKEARLLEEAFFSKRDAELIFEMRRREAEQNHKKILAEVSGIADDGVLEQLVTHEIHAEALAAFSLVPIIEVAWSDGHVQPAERLVLMKAMEEAGVQKDGLGYKLMEQWLTRPPDHELLQLWKNYTRALIGALPPDSGQQIQETVLRHARAVAEAAGGFLGLGRISDKEEKMLQSIEDAFAAKEQ